MRHENRGLRHLSPWVAALLVLGACSSEAVNSVSPGESRTVTASVPLESANSVSDRTSLIFRGDTGASLEDAALVLALFSLPQGSRNTNNLISAAGALLAPDIEAIATELDPQPNADNADFVRPEVGVQLEDVAAVFAASKFETPNADEIALGINRLLNTGVSGENIVSIPGASTPTPTPSGEPSSSPTPRPSTTPTPNSTPDPGDIAAVLAGQPCDGICNLNELATELIGANLSGQNLSNADFRGTVLEDANLSNTILNAAKLSRVKLPNATLIGATLTGADLRRVDFSDANLTNAILDGEANARVANFTNATLVGVMAPDIKAGESEFIGANLTDGTFRNGLFQSVDFSSANLNNADFSGADVRNAKFENAINLNTATFQGAVYNAAPPPAGTTFPDGFDPVAKGMILDEGD